MTAKLHIALAVLLTALYSNALANIEMKKCTLAPSIVHNGKFPTSCQGAAAGTVCTAVCQAGFSSDPLPTTTCKNGIWTTPTNRCMPSMCKGAPHALRNGHWQASCHDLAPGTTCTAICDMNSFWWYNKRGLPKSTCKKDGTWSNPDPDNCEKQPAQGCLASPSAPRSLFNCGPTSPTGAVCNATCDVGSMPGPNGAPSATCKATPSGPPVTWSAATGSCEPVCIASPPQPAHGVFSCDSPTYPGTQCNATCDNGYSGSPSATCQADGTYSTVTGSCELIHCKGNPANPANGTFNCSSLGTVLPGTNCTATCADGYKPSQLGAPSSTCQADGTYGNVTGLCEPAPPSPDLCLNLGFGTCAYNLTGAASVNLYATACNSKTRFWGERRLCWTAPASGTVQASLCSTSYDSVLAVYSGCSVEVTSAPGTELACGDDVCGSSSRATFTAVQGNQYMIRWGGYGPPQSSQSGGLIMSAV